MSKINETNYPRRTQANYADTDMLIIQAAGGNTYTTRIEDLRDDCQETMAPTVEAINDALAPAENGSTASQSYAIGEHFMRNGDFCTAIAAITSGASFTLNTNYVVGTIAEALESLSSDIAAHTLEASIDISSYTAWGSPYTCPKDGYIYIQASAASSYVYAYIHQQGVATISASAIYSSTAASNSISVRKGMKIVIAGSGTFVAAFHGLS